MGLGGKIQLRFLNQSDKYARQALELAKEEYEKTSDPYYLLKTEQLEKQLDLNERWRKAILDGTLTFDMNKKFMQENKAIKSQKTGDVIGNE